MSSQPLWLRCEKKELEHRAALTPTTAKKLIDAGFTITVERDPQRIFDDEEYEKYAMTCPQFESHQLNGILAIKLSELAAHSSTTILGRVIVPSRRQSLGSRSFPFLPSQLPIRKYNSRIATRTKMAGPRFFPASIAVAARCTILSSLQMLQAGA